MTYFLQFEDVIQKHEYISKVFHAKLLKISDFSCVLHFIHEITYLFMTCSFLL